MPKQWSSGKSRKKEISQLLTRLPNNRLESDALKTRAAHVQIPHVDGQGGHPHEAGQKHGIQNDDLSLLLPKDSASPDPPAKSDAPSQGGVGSSGAAGFMTSGVFGINSSVSSRRTL